MNCPSARSSRASGPRSTTKRVPGELRRRREIHHAERLAQLEMLLRLEAEIARLAVLLQHDVGRLVRPIGHVRIEHVGQALQHPPDRLVQRGRALFQLLHLAAQRRGLGFQRRGIGTGPPALPHFARNRVAPRLLLLQRGQGGAPLRILRRGSPTTPAPARAAPARHRTPAGSATDGTDVMHGCTASRTLPPVSAPPSSPQRWRSRKARSAAVPARSA